MLYNIHIYTDTQCSHFLPSNKSLILLTRLLNARATSRRSPISKRTDSIKSSGVNDAVKVAVKGFKIRGPPGSICCVAHGNLNREMGSVRISN